MPTSKILVYLLIILSFYAKSAVANQWWVQLTKTQQLSLRALTNQTQCPYALIDGTKKFMNVRAPSTSEPSIRHQYQSTVCELAIPLTAKHVVLDGQNVPLLPAKLKQIAIIGDTGCRLSIFQLQACNDPEQWPLKTILNQVERVKPDLVIHIGDYLYRDSPCRNQEKCGGSAYGARESTWQADWLEPASSLTRKVPFLFVRGNHEDCSRGYLGWMRYLSQEPFSEKCIKRELPWIARFNGLNLVIMDSSSVSEYTAPSGETLSLRKELLDAISSIDKSTRNFLLTHKPLWVHSATSSGNFSQAKSFGDKLPDIFQLVISGHVHTGQLISMHNNATQLIAGHSGALLYKTRSTTNEVQLAGGFTASSVNSIGNHGFAVIKLDEALVEFMDVSGKTVLQHKLLEVDS